MTAPSQLDVDLLVIGAGPAGVSAALAGARAGRRVAMIDKARFPRDKFCGDGLTTTALRELARLGLDPSGLPSWTRVDDIVVHSPSRRQVTFPLPRHDGEHAVVVRRLELDAALVDLARDAGVAVLEDHELTAIHASPDGVCAATTGSTATINAPYAVAADGMWSPTRKLLGVTSPSGSERYLGDWHAFRQYVQGATGPACDAIHVLFEPDILPGYFWTFPLGGGTLNVGFGITRGARYTTQEMKLLWPELLGRPHVRDLIGPDAVPEGPHRAWPIPAAVDTAVSHAGPVLFVGDAVAACDPMTGEGIGQALVTGRMAVDAIIEHGGEVGAAYSAALDGSLRPDHAMSALLVRAMRHRKGARVAVRVAGTSAWTRRNFARWLFEDYPRAVIVTPRRWHHGMFTAPGASFRRTEA